MLKLQSQFLDRSFEPELFKVAAFGQLGFEFRDLGLLRLDDPLQLQLTLVELESLHALTIITKQSVHIWEVVSCDLWHIACIDSDFLLHFDLPFICAYHFCCCDLFGELLWRQHCLKLLVVE